MEGFRAIIGGAHFPVRPPAQIETERERELRGLLQRMAHQNLSPSTEPVLMAVLMAVPNAVAVCFFLFLCA